MIDKHAIIQNAAGIHCRPSSIIVDACRTFESRVCVEHDGESCDLSSVMDLLCMGLERGEDVHIRACGRDEAEACACLVALFERCFDFPPRGSLPWPAAS
jgi:phosphotransferase system HPr (HPr) family protein